MARYPHDSHDPHGLSQLGAALGPLVAAAEPLALPAPHERRSVLRSEAGIMVDGLLARAARGRGALDVALGDVLATMADGDRTLRLGYASLGDYARERLGVAPRTALSMVQLARALRERPLLHAAVRAGEVSTRKALAVLPAAQGPNEAAWVARARTETVRALERAVRGATVEPAPEAWTWIGGGIGPEGRATLDEAMAVAGAVLGPSSPRWERIEAILSEYLGAHPAELPADPPEIDERRALEPEIIAWLDDERRRWDVLDTIPPVPAPGSAGERARDPDRTARLDGEPVLDRDPEPVLDRDPEPVLDRDPEPVLDRDPERVLDRDPEHVLDRDPERMLDRDPERVLDRDPERVLDRDPERVLDRDPEHVLDRDPERVLDRDPERVLDRDPERVLDRDPERVLDRDPERVLDRDPEHVLDRDPERVLDRDPERVLDRDPERVLDRDPERVLDRDPERMLDRDPERVLDRDPERVLDRAGERVLDHAPGLDGRLLALDQRLRALAGLRDRWDELVGRLALLVRGLGLWRDLQFASFAHYCHERLGLGVRTVEQRIALERSLHALPPLRAALRAGRVSYEQARVLAEHADDTTIDTLIDHAEHTPCIALRRQLEFERTAQMCARREIEERVPHSVDLLLRACRKAASAEAGTFVSCAQALVLAALHFTATWKPTLAPNRTPERRALARDRGLCQVPGCSRPAEHAHHIVYRSHGGGSDLANLTSLCSAHHLHGVHRGFIAVAGRAPDTLLWRLALPPRSGSSDTRTVHPEPNA